MTNSPKQYVKDTSTRGNLVRCTRCDRGGLRWHQTKSGRWIVIEDAYSNGGVRRHDCSGMLAQFEENARIRRHAELAGVSLSDAAMHVRNGLSVTDALRDRWTVAPRLRAITFAARYPELFHDLEGFCRATAAHIV